MDSSAGRRSSMGTLARLPAFSLGRRGSSRARATMTMAATPPTARNVVRQPSHSPTIRPSGMPSTMAMEVPVASRLSATAFLPGGATRTASEAVMDQNTACDSAMPMRLTMSEAKLQATPDSTWLATNSANTPISSLRRSTLRVSSMKGSEARATIQA